MDVEHRMNPIGRGFRVPMPRSKRYVYPLDPQPSDFFIEDIAHKLAMSCRYGGGTIRFYSTAEHCCHLFDYFDGTRNDKKVLRSALLHDRAEAWIQDLVRPIKEMCRPWYFDIETNIEYVSAPVFDIPFPNDPVVMYADHRICLDEKAQAFSFDGGRDNSVEDTTEPLGVRLRFWNPEQAYGEFMERWETVKP